MAKITCAICQQEFDNEISFHRGHLKTHKILMAEYYQKYFPRYDKLTGDIILWKGKDHYFSRDFNTREHLQEWVQKTDRPTVRAYVKMALEARIARKNLIWAPTQVELRTSMLPPMQCYVDLFGDYFALCEELGLKNRFTSRGTFQDGYGIVKRVPKPFTIFIDTREQNPLEFDQIPTLVQTLKFADYTSSEPEDTCNCYIERKSMHDFASTFAGTDNVGRFRRELDRALAAQAYVVVLVEEKLSRCTDNSIMCKFHQKSNADSIFGYVREIIQDYGNIQFLFVNGREQAANAIVKIFNSVCTYKDVDLQYLYDIGGLVL